MNKIGWIILSTWVLSACSYRNKTSTVGLPHQLPIAVSNNAVAYVAVEGEEQLYTFNGLLSGKTYQDITNQAFVWRSGQWHELSVPESQPPVLASTAVTVGQHVYVIGGYTVAADHTEKSVPNVWKINAKTQRWTAMPAMPTPVDDTVALVYKNRYIYLVSGWHDVDNVDLVQVFDTHDNTWHSASPFPLPPVFGHAGGIVGQKIMICDGVKVVKTEDSKHYAPSPECAIGTINTDDFTEIDWQSIEHHSGKAYYRMAAVASDFADFYFFGGSDNPYNYNGIGYNKIPAKPSSQIRSYHVESAQWSVTETELPASMDHRAMLKTPLGMLVLGGMSEQQTVSNRITHLTINHRDNK